MRDTLRQLAKWRPPEPIPSREGADEEGRYYTRVAIQFYDPPKPVVLGVWVALYWSTRRRISSFARPS